MDQNRSRPQVLDPRRPFDFSQASLQDYMDCARRFQLRYIQRLHWPAPQSEPLRENEAHIRRGERFHRLAQQALAGIPLERLAQMAAADPDPALARWWENFSALFPSLQPGLSRAEVMLAARTGRHRIVAKYDLVQIQPGGQVLIYDWKTHLRRPRRGALESRLQTSVYPVLLARAGQALNGGQPIPAERIEMIYWFAEFPDQPERFTFTPRKLEQNWRALSDLITEIDGLPLDGFTRTEEEKRCAFCVYRSLCDRGVQAGLFADSESDPDPDDTITIQFEQIGEIGF